MVAVPDVSKLSTDQLFAEVARISVGAHSPEVITALYAEWLTRLTRAGKVWVIHTEADDPWTDVNGTVALVSDPPQHRLHRGQNCWVAEVDRGPAILWHNPHEARDRQHGVPVEITRPELRSQRPGPTAPNPQGM